MRTTVGGRGFANRRQVSWTRAEFRELDSQTWNRNIWRSLQFLGFLVERPPTHSLQFAEPLSTRTRRIPGSVRKLGTNTVPATHCKDSLSRPRRFANLGTPTRAAVGGRGFANRRQVSWTRAEFRELDSQTWNRNIRRSLQFLGFLVERPPTHSLQFAEPLSTRTRRIPGSVRKLGTNTVPATHCKDSLSRTRRFANLGTPTLAHRRLWRRGWCRACSGDDSDRDQHCRRLSEIYHCGSSRSVPREGLWLPRVLPFTLKTLAD